MSSKGNNLVILKELGVNVPEFITFNITENNEEAFVENFQKFLNSFINPYYTGKYSVRSSGSVSTPGRMKTVLEVDSSKDSLLAAGLEVYKSTKTSRLKKYLELKGVKDFSAAIIVQEMVYPNRTEESCSGVLTTCHPVTGEDKLYGELVFGKFGDQIMSGKSDYVLLDVLGDVNLTGYYNLMDEVEIIRANFENDQEIEFVIDNNKAWILQCRDYKKVIPFGVSFSDLELIGIGTAATPISAIGTITHDITKIDETSIYLSEETDWDDTEQLLKGVGIITKKGGSLSHAAIIAREFAKPCITSASMFENFDLKEGMEVAMDSRGGIFRI